MSRKQKITSSSTEHVTDYVLEESLGFLLRDVGRIVGRALAVRIEPHGASVPIWFLLRLVSEEDGLTQREISKRLGIVEPSALQTIRATEEKGWIVRVRDTEDRRRVRIYLTPEGEAFRKRLMPLAYELNVAITRCGTPEEVEVLTRMLVNLRRNLLPPHEGEDTTAPLEG